MLSRLRLWVICNGPYGPWSALIRLLLGLAAAAVAVAGITDPMGLLFRLGGTAVPALLAVYWLVGSSSLEGVSHPEAPLRPHVWESLWCRSTQSSFGMWLRRVRLFGWQASEEEILAKLLEIRAFYWNAEKAAEKAIDEARAHGSDKSAIDSLIAAVGAAGRAYRNAVELGGHIKVFAQIFAERGKPSNPSLAFYYARLDELSGLTDSEDIRIAQEQRECEAAYMAAIGPLVPRPVTRLEDVLKSD